jgi:hypothetical protein
MARIAMEDVSILRQAIRHHWPLLQREIVAADGQLVTADLRLAIDAAGAYAHCLNQAIIADADRPADKQVLTVRSKALLGAAAIRLGILSIDLEREVRFAILADTLRGST